MNFLQLKDTPGSYVDQANKNVRVNEAETGCEFGGAYLEDGLDADKGAAGRKGRIYFATDTKILYEDDGSVWVERLRGESVTRLASLSEKLHASLSGVTSDQHHAEEHHADHENGGDQEIDVTDLSGVLAEEQPFPHAGIIDLVYPVGSIYISIVATNPATLFGSGTWIAFGIGRVLVGLDGLQAEFNTVEEQGGEKIHTLSVAEMPSHNHWGGYYTPQAFNTAPNMPGGGHDSIYVTSQGVPPQGGDAAHNNLQPYIVVYMWKRTA
jgi:hypothetical protein